MFHFLLAVLLHLSPLSRSLFRIPSPSACHFYSICVVDPVSNSNSLSKQYFMCWNENVETSGCMGESKNGKKYHRKRKREREMYCFRRTICSEPKQQINKSDEMSSLFSAKLNIPISTDANGTRLIGISWDRNGHAHDRFEEIENV